MGLWQNQISKVYGNELNADSCVFYCSRKLKVKKTVEILTLLKTTLGRPLGRTLGRPLGAGIFCNRITAVCPQNLFWTEVPKAAGKS